MSVLSWLYRRPMACSHRLLPDDKVAAIIASARASVGVSLVGLERDALMAISDDAYRAHRAFTTAKTQVDKLAAATLAPAVGHTTSAAVFAAVGDTKTYSCTRSFVKVMGINLKEKSSGTIQGQLKITKRGPSRVRQYLWLAVFRWIQTNPETDSSPYYEPPPSSCAPSAFAPASGALGLVQGAPARKADSSRGTGT